MARSAGFAASAAALCLASGLVFAQSDYDAAVELYRKRAFAEAAQRLQAHLRARPEDVPARLLLGLSLQQADEIRAAREVFAEAVRRAPRNGDARYFLARAEYLDGRLAEAETNVRLAMELGADEARGWVLLGRIREERNQPLEALKAYETAIRADPAGPSEAHLRAGALLLKLDRAGEAIERLEAAVSAQPRSQEALYQRALAYLALGDRRRAQADLRGALALGGHEQARLLLARLRAAPAGQPPTGAAFEPAAIRFQNMAGAAGVEFVHEHSPTSRKHLIETMPGGVAAFDYDGDGLVDIYFTNGAAIPSLEKESPKYFNRLYRNEGDWRFRDVTEAAGVAGAGYSMGVAVADYDNDGRPDIFVAGVRRNLLYRNRGDGTFEEIAERAGIRSDSWSVAGGWFDYDNDGFLDLFVVNYLDWSLSFDLYCGDEAAGFRVYCHPRHLRGLPNALYRNRGDGTFEDVSETSGIAAHIGKGMSLAFADYDDDGFVDVFVTNDTEPNFLFRNRGDGTFEELGLEAGVGLRDDGKAISSMGVDFRDCDNDGLPDAVVTALTGETFPLFRNLGGGVFRDVTYPSRLGLVSARRSGWSVALLDFNNDGWKDLFTANAHVTDNVEAYSDDRYRQPNSIFANRGDGTFADLSAQAGEEFQRPAAHRGAAFADFDNDGRLDAVVTVLGGQAELWRNVSPAAHGWLRVELEGARSNRDGVGARVRADNRYGWMTTAFGYASSSRQGVHFGTGKKREIEELEVIWPSGAVQTLRDVRTNRVLRLREPDGR